MSAEPASAYCCSSYGPAYWSLDPINVTTYALFGAQNNGEQIYRWRTDMPHSNRVSTNYCGNYGLYYSYDFLAHTTIYHHIGYWASGTCFALRGRSLYGSQGGYWDMWF